MTDEVAVRVMSSDGRKAWELVAWAEADPSRSAQAYAEVGELDTEDPDVRDAAQVLVTMARAANVTAGLVPEGLEEYGGEVGG